MAEIGKLGAAYDPPNPIAVLTTMQAKHVSIRDLKLQHQQKEAVEEDKRNSREDLYKTIAPLGSSIISYCKSIEMDVNDMDNLRSFVREIRGQRAKAVVVPPPGAGGTPPRTVSAAQTSYANRLDSFSKFVEKLRTQTTYKPNEPQFKLDTLDAKVDAMETANTQVVEAEADTKSLRSTLDGGLYTGADSVLKSMEVAKAYIVAVFGTKNSVYKAITKLKFRKPSRIK